MRTRSRLAGGDISRAEPEARCRPALRPLLPILTSLALFACNLFTPGPAKTVEIFLYAVEKGNLGDARKLCSGAGQGILRPVIDLWLTARMEKFQHAGGIRSIETRERVQGETATVSASLKYKNGNSERIDFRLAMEDGRWRIGL